MTRAIGTPHQFFLTHQPILQRFTPWVVHRIILEKKGAKNGLFRLWYKKKKSATLVTDDGRFE